MKHENRPKALKSPVKEKEAHYLLYVDDRLLLFTVC